MANPWLTPDEQKHLTDLIEKNDAMDIIGTGNPADAPAVRYGEQWWLMLVFQRASTGVSFRDTTHGIMEPIAINKSLPYRLAPYAGESSIPFGIPPFPKNLGRVPFYLEKSDRTIGPYADLYFLDASGKMHDPDGFIKDNASVPVYAEKHGGMSAFFQAVQMKIFMNFMRGQDRALSGKEVFPDGIG